MFKQLDKPTRSELKTTFGEDFIDQWNQDNVTCWLNDNGWGHIATVFQDQQIYGERFFQITLAELVQILPRRITTYAERRRLLNDIRTLGAANEMGSIPTNISINTDLHLFATTTNSSSPDNPSPSLPSAETPTSGHLPSNSPTTPSSASRAIAHSTTGPPTILDQHQHHQHHYQYHQCHSRHGSDVSNSSSHYLHYTSSSVDSPSTTVTRQSTNTNNNHKHPSPTRSSYSPKGAFAKIRNSFLSRTNSSNITSPPIIATDTSSQRRHPSPINTNIVDISANTSSTSLSSPPLISPRVSSMNYDANVLQQKQNNDDELCLKQQQPSIPTRISSTPDKVSRFWANYSHWHGNPTSSSQGSSSINNTSQSQEGLAHNASISVIPAKNSPPAPTTATAHPNSLQKKFDQRIQITGDKETWYSLNVKNIYNVDQLKDHILKRMNLPGDRDDYCYFHENGYESSTPLDDQALMYLCSVADHSASDRILVISHSSSSFSSTRKKLASIYSISTNTLSTPELGHSPSETSSLSSPCAIRSSHASYNHSTDLFTTATLKSSSQGQSPRSNTRLRPLCRHTASASRLKQDGPPIIGIQLSDPPPPSPLSTSSSSFNIYGTDELPPTHSPTGMDLRHSSDPTSSHTAMKTTSTTIVDKAVGLWAIPPKDKRTTTTNSNNCTSAPSPTVVLDGSLDLYDLIHPMTPISAHPITGLSPMEPYSSTSFPPPFIPPTETSPSPPLSAFSFNSSSRIVDNINDDVSPPTEDEQDVDHFWGERPPAEVVCQNMEKYFDDHDLDKEVIVPPTPPISIATPHPSENNNLSNTLSHNSATQPLSSSLSSNNITSTTPAIQGLRRHTKSIRVVAREASKKYQSNQRQLRRPSLSVTSSSSSSENGRRATSFVSSSSTPLSSYPTQHHLMPPSTAPSLLQPPTISDHNAMGSTMLRRKSTKLWGQRVVEVKPERRSRLPSSREHINMSHQHQEPRMSSTEPFNNETDVQWIRGKLIGKGSFGRVYLAFNVVSGEVIAVKQVEIPRTQSDRLDVHQNDMVDALYREIAMLRDLDHEYIVQYLGYGVDEQEAVVNIFLEYVSGGNIASRLALQGAFDEPLVRHFTRQVCEGLAYLHTRHILHRDIKSANILVEADGVCKISDFGLSKKNDYDEVYDQNSRMSLRGSVYWMAPEVVKNEPYSAKVDIWSLGCTVIEMFTGQRPWMTFNQIAALYNLGHHNAPDMPEHASDVAKDFLTKCFTIDPKYRPTALELLEHPFCALDPNFEFKDYVDKGKV